MKEKLKEFSVKAKTYKKRIAGCFMLVEPDLLKKRLAGKTYAVTRKIDGLMQLLMYENGKAYAAGSTGVIREDLPCLEEFAATLKQKGVKSALVAAELYVPSPDGRPRCYDVNSALGENGNLSKCRLAPFDLLELDGEEVTASHYQEVHQQLSALFGSSAHITPVEMRVVNSKEEVMEIFEEWVGVENAEGLVVHSECPIIWKIKPRHTIDAVIVGYSMEEGEVRNLLMAVRDENGMFRIFGKCANGFSDEERKALPEKLKPCQSNYIYVDEKQLAFRMVEPEVVLEVSVTDLLTENSAGKARKNPLISWDNGVWNPAGIVPGVSVLGMKNERFRPDKCCDQSDIRTSQLSDIAPFAVAELPEKLPESTLLDRRVFRKTSGEKVFIQKFLIWASNKADFGYGKYIFYHTDYSSSRKEPLKRDLKVAATEEKIRQFMEQAIAENVKKNYMEVELCA